MSNTVKLVPFLEVVKDVTSTFPKVKKLDYLNSGKFPIIDQSKNDIAGYTNNNSLINNWNNEEVVIFGDHTRVVKYVDFPIAIGADGVKVLKINSNISDSKYLYYFLKTTKIHDAGYSRHYKFLKALKIPVLPLPEQQKIASFLTRIEALIQKREESIQLLDELIKSTFLELFGDPVLNPKGWDVVKLGDLTKISSGSTPSRKDSANYGGDIPWVKTTEVRSQLIVETLEYISEQGLANSSCKLYPKGSVIIAMYGQGKTRGQVGILGINATTNQACAVLPPSGNYNSYYVYYLLQNLYEHLRALGQGGNQPNLNAGLIKNYTIILPPAEFQCKFSTIVTKIETTKEKYQTSLEELNNLFNSTAQKAFKGELNLGKIAVTEKEISKVEAQILDEDTILALIKSGGFEAKDHVNEQQSYDDIRDKVLKLMDEGKITQKFATDKKMVLEAVNAR